MKQIQKHILWCAIMQGEADHTSAICSDHRGFIE